MIMSLIELDVCIAVVSPVVFGLSIADQTKVELTVLVKLISTRLSEQITVSLLVKEGAFSMMISILSSTDIHEPPGLTEVNVKITEVSEGAGV